MELITIYFHFIYLFVCILCIITAKYLETPERFLLTRLSQL